jgi:hypothetical protein
MNRGKQNLEDFQFLNDKKKIPFFFPISEKNYQEENKVYIASKEDLGLVKAYKINTTYFRCLPTASTSMELHRHHSS